MKTNSPPVDEESSIRYPGWSVLAAAFTGVMVGFAPIVPYTFSLFLYPLHAAFGWKREAMGGAFGLAAITVAFVSPLIGILLDRFPPRRTILPGILVFAVGLAALSRLTPNIVQFYATFFVIGLVTAAFWILAFITIFSAFSETGLVTNLSSILTQHGMLAATAALALSVRGGAGIIGRLGIGFAIDRVSPERIQSLVLVLAAAGTLILAFAGTAWSALLGAAILGVGLGSEADVGPYLLARYFGRRHFSVLYGLSWTAYAIGGATGPLWMGHLYDRAGAYLPRFIAYLASVAFGAMILSFFLRSDQKSTTFKRKMTANAGVPLED
jgi:MFS family permease